MNHDSAWYSIQKLLLPEEEVLSYSEGFHERDGLFSAGGGSRRFWVAITPFRIMTVDEQAPDSFGNPAKIYPVSWVYSEYPQLSISPAQGGWHPVNVDPPDPMDEFTTGAMLLTGETAAVLRSVLEEQADVYLELPESSASCIAVDREFDRSSADGAAFAAATGPSVTEYLCGHCQGSLGFDRANSVARCPACLRLVEWN